MAVHPGAVGRVLAVRELALRQLGELCTQAVLTVPYACLILCRWSLEALLRTV